MDRSDQTAVARGELPGSQGDSRLIAELLAEALILRVLFTGGQLTSGLGRL